MSSGRSVLEEDDVRYHLGTGILFERVIRQTNSSQQLSTLSKIPAHGGILGVHSIAGGYKSHHAAGTHLVQCFGEKVVVNTEIQLVVGFVIDLILTERYIADGKVKEVTPIGGLKAAYCDVRLGIELLCDAPGNRVSSTPYRRLFRIFSGSIPKKLPTPIDGSRIFPVSNPIRSTAS